VTAAEVSARDRDLAPIAVLFGDPARVAMLSALAAGHALPAGDLARAAGVHPATATAHLRRLIDAGLVRVRAQGRHRYHELAGPQVNEVLEALAQLSPPVPVTSLRQQRTATATVEARTCYDHLAGRRGVQLRDRLLDADAIRLINDRDHVLTDHGHGLLANVGLDPAALPRRRVFARSCVDWTDRRPHLAGALAAAITQRLIDQAWLTPGPGRALNVSPTTTSGSTAGSPEPSWPAGWNHVPVTDRLADA